MFRTPEAGRPAAHAMKVFIFIFSLVSIIIGIVAISMVGGFGLLLQCEQLRGDPTGFGYQQCSAELASNVARVGSTVILLFTVAGAMVLIAFLFGLGSTIVNRRWGWLLVILFLGNWGLLFYGAFGGEGSVIDVVFGGAGGGGRTRWGRQGGQLRASNAPGFEALPNSVQPGLCWQCGGRVKLDSRICLNCGATQAYVEIHHSLAAQVTGFDPDNANGAFPPVPHPVSAPSWAPPPPGYQQPGQPPAMPPGYPPPDYQQSGYQQPGYQPSAYPPPDYQQSGYQQPGQPPTPGGPGWGSGYN